MQGLKSLGAAAALGLSVAGGAYGQEAAFHGQARLATPLAAPVTATVNGVTWTCAGDACTGEAARYGSLDSTVRACKRVAAAFGPLTAYSARGLTVAGGSLKVCNSAASPPPAGATSVAARQ